VKDSSVADALDRRVIHVINKVNFEKFIISNSLIIN
tara:strand:- start:11908 stop:12015 length:108 start_codon:yes stop_codon:yes gene_type:complete